MQRNVKITSVLMLLILSAVVVYLTISVEDKPNKQVSLVELKGNIHLPKDQYFKFAGLNDIQKQNDVNIAIIRDRLSKHPYIQKVDVAIKENRLMIDISEKRFEAILFSKDKQFFVTDNSVLVPVLPYTQQINYPIISNPKIENEILPMTSVLKQKDIVTALKILSAAKLVNPDLSDALSEINLRNGKDILVQFSSMDYPVIIGRGSEIRKILTFNTLWDYLSSNKSSAIINYVDLRYAEHVFLGFIDEESPEKDSTI